MTYRVEITAGAETDLQSAFAYIAADSSERARHWRDGLYEHADSLASSPLRCGLAIEAAEVGCEIRELLYGNYRLLFTIRGGTVYIVHVRHAARRPLTRDELRRFMPRE